MFVSSYLRLTTSKPYKLSILLWIVIFLYLAWVFALCRSLSCVYLLFKFLNNYLKKHAPFCSLSIFIMILLILYIFTLFDCWLRLLLDLNFLHVCKLCLKIIGKKWNKKNFLWKYNSVRDPNYDYFYKNY